MLLIEVEGGEPVRWVFCRPALLEFFRTHLILTALGDVAALAIGVLVILVGKVDGGMAGLPVFGSGNHPHIGNILVGGVLLLCLLAYPVAARASRQKNGWPRPDAVDAAVVLLLPALAFWMLLFISSVVLRQNVGIQIAAILLNAPAYGLSVQLVSALGAVSGAGEWLGYVGTMASGLLPPLLFLIGSCPAIPSVDDEAEDYIEKQ